MKNAKKIAPNRSDAAIGSYFARIFDELAFELLSNIHQKVILRKKIIACGKNKLFCYTPSPAEAEFDDLTAGLITIQLCL